MCIPVNNCGDCLCCIFILLPFLTPFLLFLFSSFTSDTPDFNTTHFKQASSVNFDKFHTFILFYVEGDHTLETCSNAAEVLYSDKVSIGYIDCNMNRQTECSERTTLKYYRNGQLYSTTSAVNNDFFSVIYDKEVEEIESYKQLKGISDSKYVLGFFRDEDSWYDVFESVSRRIRFIKFYKIVHDNILMISHFKRTDVMEQVLVIDNGEVMYSIEKNKLNEDVLIGNIKKVLGGVQKYNNYSKVYDFIGVPVVIWFLEKGESNIPDEYMMDIQNRLGDKVLMTYTELSENEQIYYDMFKGTITDFVKIGVIDKRLKAVNYVRYIGRKKDSDVIYEWIVSVLQRSQKIPDEQGDIYTVVTDTYKETVMNNSVDVLLFLDYNYQLETVFPEYQEFAELVKSIKHKLVVAKIDASINRPDDKNVKWSLRKPRILFFRSKDKYAPKMYSNKKHKFSIGKLIKFVMLYASAAKNEFKNLLEDNKELFEKYTDIKLKEVTKKNTDDGEKEQNVVKVKELDPNKEDVMDDEIFEFSGESNQHDDSTYKMSGMSRWILIPIYICTFYVLMRIFQDCCQKKKIEPKKRISRKKVSLKRPSHPSIIEHLKAKHPDLFSGTGQAILEHIQQLLVEEKNRIIAFSELIDERIKKLRDEHDERLECKICNDASVSIVLNCGHTLCKSCHNEILKRRNECPFCKTRITQSTKMFI